MARSSPEPLSTDALVRLLRQDDPAKFVRVNKNIAIGPDYLFHSEIAEQAGLALLQISLKSCCHDAGLFSLTPVSLTVCSESTLLDHLDKAGRTIPLPRANQPQMLEQRIATCESIDPYLQPALEILKVSPSTLQYSLLGIMFVRPNTTTLFKTYP